MDLVRSLLDAILHVDQHLGVLAHEYGVWTYGILFLVVFCETGLVVTPFLPGDSLLFAAGALSATGALDIVLLFILLNLAPLLGDSTNYWIGRKLGRAAFDGRFRFLKQEHLARTERFYEKYGGKTLILARFVPIVRTYAPFVAGAGRMRYARFVTFSFLAALIWTTLFVLGGYWFGNIPVVRENFGLVVIAIIAVSLLPPLVEIVRHRLQARRIEARPPTSGV
jgi:membrane-associated protein